MGALENIVWIWLIAGALLIASEFLITGIIALFFGAGALGVALALWLGLIDSPAEQLTLFAVLSVASLLLAREKLRKWFRGKVSHLGPGDGDVISARGNRVTVTRDFHEGAGVVRLSGAEWNAESTDPDAAPREGDTLWVVGHRGITLEVTAIRPTSSDPAEPDA